MPLDFRTDVARGARARAVSIGLLDLRRDRRRLDDAAQIVVAGDQRRRSPPDRVPRVRRRRPCAMTSNSAAAYRRASVRALMPHLGSVLIDQARLIVGRDRLFERAGGRASSRASAVCSTSCAARLTELEVDVAARPFEQLLARLLGGGLHARALVHELFLAGGASSRARPAARPAAIARRSTAARLPTARPPPRPVRGAPSRCACADRSRPASSGSRRARRPESRS